MKKLVILFLLISGAALYSYTPPDSCLKLICTNDSTVIWDSIQVSYRRVPPWNPDSVRVDSCPTSQTYLKKYAKKYFVLNFKSYPFNSAIPKDSIWFVSQLKDSITKAQFQQLELLFGTCYFFRDKINDLPDSTIVKYGDVFIAFDLYQNIDSVISFLNNNIDSLFLSSYYDRWLIEEMFVDVDEKIKSEIFLTPNPASDYIEISVGAQRAVPDNIAIFDILGVEVTTPQWASPLLRNRDTPPYQGGEIVRLDVSYLTPGVYFVRVGDVVRKFVKI